ncbi:MAG: penicillin acylase family protein [Candidatus Heimdallarchaeota archaeon]|nr:penicillin acylase family protein [Candidatus Heimdallarchaeota archaeon]MDH5645106.1 penicillin acylase family protein [Candidatus Heimdallarchaeota archaeon]
MNPILKKFLTILLIIILSFLLGLYAGLKNSTDYQIDELITSEVKEKVYVYRDEYGIPTIVANNLDDLFFAQGYEFARDRLWQAELLRLLIHGDLALVFGSELIDGSKYYKSLELLRAAQTVLDQTDGETIEVYNNYLRGINTFIDLHQENLPVEFLLIDHKPQHWQLVEAFAIQGIMAEDLSIAGIKREILRRNLAETFGGEESLDIFPIQNIEAETYLINTFTESLVGMNYDISQSAIDIIDELEITENKGSNAWVVSSTKTASGFPLLANDPHLSLTTPSIWWQVQLIVEGQFHVQGFSLPVSPGIVIGHNDHVSWGVTNSRLDAIDLFYLKTNDQGQYFHDNTWKDFEVVNKDIEVKDGETVSYALKWTDIGQVLDPDIFPVDNRHVYVMRWTLHEDNPRNKIQEAILGLNKATDINEAIESLRYFSVPSQNVVIADTSGKIAYQLAGLVPNRKVLGSGIVPQNGSDPAFGWDGMHPYEDSYRVIDPEEGYIVTANDKFDFRDEEDVSQSIYISDLFEVEYRADRINQLLNNKNDLDVYDMMNIQGDIKDLHAEYLIRILGNDLISIKSSVSSDSNLYKSINEMLMWANEDKFNMSIEDRGPTIFSVFSIYLEESTFYDEISTIGDNMYNLYHSFAINGIRNVVTNPNSIYFDNIDTSITETRIDIVREAMEKTVEFLEEAIGSRVSSWRYEKLHIVEFKHAFDMNSFNEGNTPVDGSRTTVKATNTSPKWSETGPELLVTVGASLRIVSEVTSTWDNVFGIMAPGQSAHFFTGHRGDSVDDWVNNISHRWIYGIPDEDVDFTYIPEI